jgi:hypothetical protein
MCYPDYLEKAYLFPPFFKVRMDFPGRVLKIFPRPFKQLDVMVLQYIGKEISGPGWTRI